jgi:hypothetical protein
MEEMTAMNEHQTLFTLFFAIYYAISTTTTGKLHPFDTPTLYKSLCKDKCYPRTWFRLFASLIILNISPLLLFYIFYIKLGAITKDLNLCGLIAIFSISLIGQGFYRFYYGLMLCSRDEDKYIFYDDELYLDQTSNKNEKKFPGLPTSFSKDLKSRPVTHRNKWAHIIPGIGWIIVSTLPFLFYVWL